MYSYRRTLLPLFLKYYLSVQPIKNFSVEFYSGHLYGNLKAFLFYKISF